MFILLYSAVFFLFFFIVLTKYFCFSSIYIHLFSTISFLYLFFRSAVILHWKLHWFRGDFNRAQDNYSLTAKLGQSYSASPAIQAVWSDIVLYVLYHSRSILSRQLYICNSILTIKHISCGFPTIFNPRWNKLQTKVVWIFPKSEKWTPDLRIGWEVEMFSSEPTRKKRHHDKIQTVVPFPACLQCQDYRKRLSPLLL